jgi:hypothetical protein
MESRSVAALDTDVAARFSGRTSLDDVLVEPVVRRHRPELARIGPVARQVDLEWDRPEHRELRGAREQELHPRRVARVGARTGAEQLADQVG